MDLDGFEPSTSSMPWKKRPSSYSIFTENKALVRALLCGQSAGFAGLLGVLRELCGKENTGSTGLTPFPQDSLFLGFNWRGRRELLS